MDNENTTPGGMIGGGVLILAISAFFLWSNGRAPAEQRLDVQATLQSCEKREERQGRRIATYWHLRLDDSPGQVKLRTDDAHDARLAQLCADHDRVQLVVQGTQSFRVMGLWDSSGQMVVSEKASRRNELVNRMTGNLVFWGMALLGAGAIVVGIKKQREE